MQLLDKQGSPQSTYRYDAFGNFSTAGTLTCPWLFSGQRYDPANALYQFNKRDYDPTLGRWLTCDPLGLADGPNLYAYVHNNPLIYIDPYGLFQEESKDFMHGVSRGAADDTSWGATTLALGEFQPKGISGQIGYYAGTTASFAAGFYYGASEVKAARYITHLFRRAIQKAPTHSLKATQTIKTVSKIEKAQVSTDLAKMPEKLSTVTEKIQKLTNQNVKKQTGSNPFNRNITKDIMVVDHKGNIIPIRPGQHLTGSPDGKWLQVRDSLGNPTGLRKDGPHSPRTHNDPRALQPHSHVPGITNSDGTPWLPINY